MEEKLNKNITEDKDSIIRIIVGEDVNEDEGKRWEIVSSSLLLKGREAWQTSGASPNTVPTGGVCPGWPQSFTKDMRAVWQISYYAVIVPNGPYHDQRRVWSAGGDLDVSEVVLIHVFSCVFSTCLCVYKLSMYIMHVYMLIVSLNLLR